MQTKIVNDVQIVLIVEKFDALSSKNVEEEIMGLIAAGAKKILCDFSATEYISSAGLRVLLSAAKRMQRSAGAIILCSLKPDVYKVFDLAGFIQLFKIFPSQEEALKNF